ncbi:Rv3235 family protein [Pseudonocardia acidicola]|uniref:Uncharacterized protein n=1 Tax=Pseudonocardia acidicola TaxID=2724939 RepID=A0ABX1SM81_9PSEU|nr:Rv3235 family protein [Pseudonocardia acidicola]NMI02196.1 hypothetical protein [Pseudonocardia acidicola]
MRTTDTAQTTETTEASCGPIVVSRARYEPIPDEHAAVVLTECPQCGHDLTESAPAQVAARPAPALLGEITADVTRDPAVGPRAHRVLVTLLEALDGRRPYSQMVALATPQVIRYLRVAAELYRRDHSPSRVLSCHVSQPHEGAAEVAALCRIGRRARALAARFELAEAGDWRCIALRVL